MSNTELCKLIMEIRDNDNQITESNTTLSTLININKTHSIELVANYLENNTDELKRIFIEDRRTRNLILNTFSTIDKQILLNLGFFNGIYFITDLLVNEKEKKRKDTELISRYITTRKHTSKIFLYLFKHPSAMHKELAQALALSPSGLTAILKELINDNLIEKTEQSKYSYYSLSEISYNYTKNELIAKKNIPNRFFCTHQKNLKEQYNNTNLFEINIPKKERINDD